MPLIASFFGEFNTIDGQLVYANRLKMVEKSDLKATVIQSYFKGTHYLVEADLNDEIVFFEHASEIKKKEAIYLDIMPS